MNRIIAKKTLVKFWEVHTDSEDALDAWYTIAEKAHWNTPQDVKDTFRDASIIGDNRVVFNIKGNKYRLIVFINYEAHSIYIKWIGTHSDYSKINAEIVAVTKPRRPTRRPSQ